MATPLPRIQVLAEPDLFAWVKTIAKGRNKTLSATAAEMLADCKKQGCYVEEYEQAAAKYGAVPAPPDTRKRPKQQPHRKVTEPREEWINPEATEEEIAMSRAYEAVSKTSQVSPVKTPEQQATIIKMYKEGLITHEQMGELFRPQTPEPGQSKEEKQVDMRQDLLKTIGEQDERLKAMEKMMGEMAAMITSTKSQ